MSDCREITVDCCVLVHCDSSAKNAINYCDNSGSFVQWFEKDKTTVVCLNAGIRREYTRLTTGRGRDWHRSMISQGRYRDKGRAIRDAERRDFINRKKVPLHSEDFDYVDAASQSSTQMWLSNEVTWRNTTYRSRIRGQYGVTVLDVNEYMPSVAI